jgi:hypothetical protein
LIEARNNSHRQPALNLQIAQAYLTASDPACRYAFGKTSWIKFKFTARSPPRTATCEP